MKRIVLKTSYIFKFLSSEPTIVIYYSPVDNFEKKNVFRSREKDDSVFFERAPSNTHLPII